MDLNSFKSCLFISFHPFAEASAAQRYAAPGRVSVQTPCQPGVARHRSRGVACYLQNSKMPSRTAERQTHRGLANPRVVTVLAKAEVTRMKLYHTIEELPCSLRQELPETALRLYLAVYQRTWESCTMGGETGGEGLAESAHEAAMLAVQRRFDKDEQGQWRQSPVGEAIDPDKLEGLAPDVDSDVDPIDDN